jgi:hypothetical protein
MKPNSKNKDKSTFSKDARDLPKDAESETTSRSIVFTDVPETPAGRETTESVDNETKSSGETVKSATSILAVSDKADSNGHAVIDSTSAAIAEKSETFPVKEDTEAVSSVPTTEEEKVDVSALAKARSNKKVHHHAPSKNSPAAAALKEMKASQNGGKKKKKGKRK